MWPVLWLASVLLPLCACTRPELVASSVWYTNQTIANIPFQYAVVSMEFDQPLYATGNTFLCSSADRACPQPLNCTPCDWSGQNVGISLEFSLSFL